MNERNQINAYAGVLGMNVVNRNTGLQNAIAQPIQHVAMGVFAAGRWSGFETCIRNAAWQHDASLTLEIERGWLANVYRVRLYGASAKDALDEIYAVYRDRANREKRK